MRVQADLIDLRRMIEEGVQEVFADKEVADMVFRKINSYVEDDDRLRIINDGKWIATKYDNIMRCSECNHELGIIAETAFRYCPFCGSRMEADHDSD